MNILFLSVGFFFTCGAAAIGLAESFAGYRPSNPMVSLVFLALGLLALVGYELVRIADALTKHKKRREKQVDDK